VTPNARRGPPNLRTMMESRAAAEQHRIFLVHVRRGSRAGGLDRGCRAALAAWTAQQGLPAGPRGEEAQLVTGPPKARSSGRGRKTSRRRFASPDQHSGDQRQRISCAGTHPPSGWSRSSGVPRDRPAPGTGGFWKDGREVDSFSPRQAAGRQRTTRAMASTVSRPPRPD